MARQGGWVQLEQSDMCLPWNMAEIAKGGFSRAAIDETRFLIKKPLAEVQAEKKLGVEFPGHKNMKGGMERLPAVLRANQMDSCPACQNSTAQISQTRWRRKVTGAPPPVQLRQLIPGPTPHSPRTPLVLPCTNEAAHISKIESVPPGYVYMHTPLPSAQFFNLEAYAQDCKCDEDYNPDLLTDDRISTG